jgi:hypothetical protein
MQKYSHKVGINDVHQFLVEDKINYQRCLIAELFNNRVRLKGSPATLQFHWAQNVLASLLG